MTFSTRDEAQEFLNEHFNDKFEHWEVDTRIIWIYQKHLGGTGKYASQTNLNYTVVGLIGNGATLVDQQEDSVTFSKESRYNRKPYTTLTTITRTEDGFKMMKYVGFLYETYLESMGLMRGKPDYLKAIEIGGLGDNPTDEEVATVMATQHYGLRKDVPDFLPDEVTAKVEAAMVDGKLEVTGNFLINGEPAQPLRWMYWVVPAKGAIGTASSYKAAGEYIGGRKKFTVNTDFRDRYSYMIMHTEDVKIRMYAQYKEADGDLRMVKDEVTIDLTGALPLYDYFGLAGK